MCKTYQNPSKLKSVLNKYARSLSNGKNKVIIDGKEYVIKKKCLNIALPDIPFTTSQKNVLTEFIIDNSEFFDVVITIVS